MQKTQKVMPIEVFVVAASLFLVTVAVNLEVPLYRTYAQAAGYGNGLTAVVFAAYVAGLLPVLILLGGISDRLGRKPIILLGLVSAILATLLITVRPNIHMLFITRVLQGVGVGLSVGAGTAYLAEILGLPHGPSRAAYYTSLTTALGFGSGALLTNAALLYRSSLVPISYWGVLALMLLCIVFMIRLPESRNRTITPLLRLPHFPNGTVRFGLAIAVAWSVTGLVISMISVELARHQLTVWIGPALFLAIGIGTFFQPLARNLNPDRSVLIGFVLITLGYTFLVIGVWFSMISLILIGSVIAGSACYGFTYLGGLAAVTKAAGEERARAVSGYFLLAYLGFSLPSVLIGFLADLVGVKIALVVFGIIIIAANALLGFQLNSSR
jgi:MFS family permease